MNNFTAFTQTNDEHQANIIGSSLEKMNPTPIGIGVFEMEDGSGTVSYTHLTLPTKRIV